MEETAPHTVEPAGADPFRLPELRDEDFRFLSGLVRSRFGINLTEQKRSLVVGRLQKLVREQGFADFSAYCRHLRQQAGDRELDDLVNRLSTNHTYFFREPEHFAFMREVVLPEMKARHREDRDLRLWCAAAATGEEPYSALITMLEFFGPAYAEWDGGVLATDISARALATARRGVYHRERLDQVPPDLRRRYFAPLPGRSEWQVKQRLRADVTFRRFNLIRNDFPFRKPFDLVFCRNVMIYFDQPTRDRLAARFADFITPGGYLFTGHSESLGQEHPRLRYVRPAVYRRVG
jgi:chemotaxis protein methyltransferase CheR